MTQPIETAQRRSSDPTSSPLVTPSPSGTPPPTFFHSQWQHGIGAPSSGLHHFFSAAAAAAMESGPSGSGSGIGEKRRSSEGYWNGQQMYPSRDAAPRHSISFFSNLSLTRPSPHPHPQPQSATTAAVPQYHFGRPFGGVAMTKSTTGDSSDSMGTDHTSIGGVTSRPDPTRSATAPVVVEPMPQALPKRHYDPCREPKLLHFM